MVPLDGDEDIGEVGRGFFGKATIPFGRVQQPGVQRPARIGRIETATTFIHPMKATNRSASRRSKNSSVRRGQPVQASAQMPVIHSHAAGIDVGATSHWVCVPEDAVAEGQSSVREFGAFTKDLDELVEWLLKCQVKTVAMESTSVYWIPLFQKLEAAGLEAVLVNARHVRHVPGRKTIAKTASGCKGCTATGCSTVRSVRAMISAVCAVLCGTGDNLSKACRQ